MMSSDDQDRARIAPPIFAENVHSAATAKQESPEDPSIRDEFVPYSGYGEQAEDGAHAATSSRGDQRDQHQRR